MLEIPGVPREVDPDAFDQFLSQRYVPGPRTMFKDIFRLQPGHTLVVELQAASRRANPEVLGYRLQRPDFRFTRADR